MEAMASSSSLSCISQLYCSKTPQSLIPKTKPFSTPCFPSCYASKSDAHQPQGAERGVTEPYPLPISGSLSSTRTQLELLDQLTSTADGYESDDGSSRGLTTIRDQLAQLVGDRDDDFSIPLGKKNLKRVSAKFLTVSQKRNIRRQAYLDQTSQRNDSVFFATIGAFVILPPIIILGIAIFTGYVQLFP